MRISDWSSDVCSSDLCALFIPDTFGKSPGIQRHLLGIAIHHHHHRRLLIIPEIDIHAVFRDELQHLTGMQHGMLLAVIRRSEERRVGKECVSTCRSGWWTYH